MAPIDVVILTSPDPDNPTVPSDLILICEASANRGPSASSRINPVVFNSKVPPPEIVDPFFVPTIKLVVFDSYLSEVI